MFYDLLYKNKNYKKESDYILSILKKYKIFKGNLLEFGSGELESMVVCLPQTDTKSMVLKKVRI